MTPAWFKDYLSRQYAMPSGWFGKLIITRYLNRVNQNTNQWVLDLLMPNAGEEILEIGFGGGLLLIPVANRIAPGRLTALELSEDVIQAARNRCTGLPIDVLKGDVMDLPLSGETVDAIYTVNTLYFWPDLINGLNECHRVLKPGGRLLVGFGDSEDLEQQGFGARGFNLVDLKFLEKTILEQGFSGWQVHTMQRKNRGRFHVIQCLKPGANDHA